MAFMVLTGIPGVGKTATARALSNYYGVQYCDIDQLIVEQASLSISEIFSTLGEAEFRKIEQRTTQEALNRFDGVVALGGGAVLSESTRQALQGQFVVYLTVDAQEAIRRIDSEPGKRPMFADEKFESESERLAFLQQLRDSRVHLYEEVATVTVDTTGKTLALIVAEIAASYAAWNRIQ